MTAATSSNAERTDDAGAAQSVAPTNAQDASSWPGRRGRGNGHGALDQPFYLTLAQSLLRALCFVVIPALLAGLTIRYLVPEPASSERFLNGVAVTVNRFPIPCVLGLFLLFAALVRYWFPRAPGGGYASALPVRIATYTARRDVRAYAKAAEMHGLLRKHTLLKTLAKTLPKEEYVSIGDRLNELAAALEGNDADRLPSIVSELHTVAGPLLAARQRRETLWLILGLTTVGAAALILRMVVVGTYQVLSGSMLPALRAGDTIVVNKLAPLPRRGDLVVFHNIVSDGPEHLVKRVIALPGDTVTMRGDRPVINGWTVPGCDAGLYVYPVVDGAIRGRLRVEFLGAHAYATIQSAGTPMPGPYVVKDGELFVLGDNRTSSSDSRSWNGGQGAGVPFGVVEGRAAFFFLATRRDGRIDFAEFMGSLDRRLTAEGIDARSLEQGIARCLSEWPSETEPPPKVVASNGADRGS